MAKSLQVDQDLSATAQSVKDQDGKTSSLTLSSDKVGIGTTEPRAKLEVNGNILTTGATVQGDEVVRHCLSHQVQIFTGKTR